MSPKFQLGSRTVGPSHPPLVVAEIGINHEGDIDKAIRMVDDAHAAGCECVKFQCHVIEDEMIPNDVIPGNATESIWDIMARCALTEEEEDRLKEYVEARACSISVPPFLELRQNVWSKWVSGPTKSVLVNVTIIPWCSILLRMASQ